MIEFDQDMSPREKLLHILPNGTAPPPCNGLSISGFGYPGRHVDNAPDLWQSVETLV